MKVVSGYSKTSMRYAMRQVTKPSGVTLRSNDDPVSGEAPEFEHVLSENVPVPDQLLAGNETTLSIDECSVNGDSKEEIENLKRKLNLLQKKFLQNKQEMDNLEKHLSVIFTDDQIAFLTKGFSKGLEFSDESFLSFEIDFEKSEIEICDPESDFLNITYAEKLCFDIDFDKADMEMHNEIVEIALPESDENSLYYLCGCVGKIILSRSKLCPTCIGTVSPNSSCSNDNRQMFSKMKEFRRDVNSLVYVSEEVFTVL
ncbi:hypothetical protein AVEN_33724-1 [Araneus ventricosus]|uniref:Uncharacterized protein n=1 Tax=Araneus ventricosus TaxID=182803 RepID=A0A4Y2LG86_ARAVE|nr:hypothetical protein AVEN_33724-1 [Araneus ventricosus]